MSDPTDPKPRGPVDPLVVPRFAGPSTFARLPTLDEVGHCDVAVVGVPFDSGVTFRPGARFGPIAVRQASRLLRPYHAALDVHPFAAQQVADAGDIPCTPFSIPEAIAQIEAGADALLGRARHFVAIGGDHTISLPLLRAFHKRHGAAAPPDDRRQLHRTARFPGTHAVGSAGPRLVYLGAGDHAADDPLRDR